jgi:hypothetical protein
MDSDAPSPEPMLYLFIYACHSPQNGALPRNETEHTVTVHGATRERKVYTEWCATWFPGGIVNVTAISAPVPNRLQHDTLHLDFGRPQPR